MTEGSDLVRINERVSIPLAELSFTAARAGGPGGQHVNTTSSSVTLWFDVENSPSLTPAMKARIRERLANRIGVDGRLRIISREARSQHANRQQAIIRFAELLGEALKVKKHRRKTKPTLASQERRVEGKKKRASVKKARGKVKSWD